MSAPTASAADPLPRRRPSHHGELTAALGVVAAVTHLLFAQVTLVLLACGLATGSVGRWRPLWLAAPAAAGTLWAAATGVSRAVAGFVAGPRQVAAYLAGTPGHPGRLLHLSAAFAGAGHWLPRQIPVALVVAAAEAAILAWLGGPGGSPRDGESYRPGLVIAVRRRLTRAALVAGRVVTADGCSLGLEEASGRRAELSWAEAGGGVVMICADPQAGGRAGFPLACAAVRRRKSVIVVDFTGSQWLAAALPAVCAVAGAPLSRFSSAGPGCYEPFRSHPPGRAASLVAQMIDWTGTTDQQRQAGRRFLADAFAILAATPAAVTVLDGLVALLEPATLRGAMGKVPGHVPNREELAQRVAGSASALSSEPAIVAALSAQLHRLSASAPGRWLRAPAAELAASVSRTGAGPAAGGSRAAITGPPVSVGQAVRERGAVLFSLDRGAADGPAAMVGRLAVADLAAVLRGLRDSRLRGDGLAWIHGCESVDQQSLAELMAVGRETGTAVLLSTGRAAVAAHLAPAARVVVTAGPADRGLATRLAELAEFRGTGSQQDVAELLRWQDEDEFAVMARGPAPRFQHECRTVPAPWAQLR